MWQTYSRQFSADIYALRAENITKTSEILASILNLEWEERKSSFMGDYYNVGMTGEEHLQLRLNYWQPEGWTKPDYKEYPFLFYVSASDRGPQIEEQLRQSLAENITLIERKVRNP